jgi:hypothetical protein
VIRRCWPRILFLVVMLICHSLSRWLIRICWSVASRRKTSIFIIIIIIIHLLSSLYIYIQGILTRILCRPIPHSFLWSINSFICTSNTISFLRGRRSSDKILRRFIRLLITLMKMISSSNKKNMIRNMFDYYYYYLWIILYAVLLISSGQTLLLLLFPFSIVVLFPLLSSILSLSINVVIGSC